MENNDVLTIENLVKTYPSFHLDNVSFSVKKGHIVGFIGVNGAGKSTTMKSLFNFVHKDSGKVTFFGLDFDEHEKEIKSRVGFVSGGIDYYPLKKIRLIAEITKSFFPNWDDESYKKYVKKFNLDENKTPKQLSCGMRLKFSLSLALSHKAELLVLDEPTSGLDPISREELLDTFLDLASNGVSILFSSHITSDLEKCADDIVYIHQGKILVNEPQDILENKYMLVNFEAYPQPEIAKVCIGLKTVKRGYQALVEKNEFEKLHLEGEKASLEDLMIHFEKEEANNETLNK